MDAVFIHPHLAFYDSLSRYSVYAQGSFSPYLVSAWLTKVNIFNDLSGKGCFRVPGAFQVVLVEMFSLQWTVEPLKGVHFDGKGKCSLPGVYGTPELFAGCADQLQRSIGFELYFAGECQINLPGSF